MKKILLRVIMFVMTMFYVGHVGAQTQSLIISGTVRDRADNMPIPGASVRVKGTQTGTVTNGEGKYTIAVPSGTAVLVFTYIGYTPQEETVGSKTVINLSIAEVKNDLNEVVVVGYGTQKRADITSAVSTIDGKEILKSPTANATNSLVGKVTGVVAVQAGGQPGRDAAVINVRGISTYGSAGAIVIVDGIERPDFGNIDPNEIENISVLKDAASTAVYGIRGANGVIVVTTKVGKEGAPKISYSGNVSAQSFTGLPKTLNSYDNALLINEGIRNDDPNATLRWTDAELQKFKDGSDPLGYPDVNWLDYLVKDHYMQTQHNLNVRGGTKVIKYYVSAGYLFQDGIFKKFDSPFGIQSTPDYNRFNFRSNVDINLTDNLTFGVKLGGRLERIYTPSGLKSSGFPYDSFEGIFSRALQTPNFAFPVMLPDGRIAQNGDVGTNIWNPLAAITRFGTRNDDNNTIESTFNLNYKMDWLTKGLSFRATFAYDSYFTSTTERNASWAAYQYDRRTGVISLSADRTRDEPLSTLNPLTGGNISTNVQAGFDYKRSFEGGHNVTGVLLGTRQLISVEGETAYLAPPRASQGLVLRAAYNFKEKYYAEFNAGYNGSENFPKGQRYGFFPAASAGWNLHKESFMEDIKFVSSFKLRGSYGLVGNDQLGTKENPLRFLYLTNYEAQTGTSGIQFGSPTSVVNYPTIYLPDGALGNSFITWETGTKRDIGIESKFFNSSLTFNLDFYDETRRDILTTRSRTTGSGSLLFGHVYPSLNVGEVYNKGYEAEIDYANKIGNVNWGINAQLSYSRNIIRDRDEPINAPDALKQAGNRVGQFYGYRSLGFYTSAADIAASPVNQLGTVIPGDLKFEDLNGDGFINSDDRTSIGYSRNPEYTYSFSPRIEWKGLSVSVLFQGVANVSSDLILNEQNNGSQMYEFMLDRWTPATAATATWPAIHARSTPSSNYSLNDFTLQNAAYLKIRNAEISYNLPQSILKSLKIPAIRVFVNGQNLYTWTKFKMYFDPENVNLSVTNFSKQSVYPTSKVYNLGVNIQL